MKKYALIRNGICENIIPISDEMLEKIDYYEKIAVDGYPHEIKIGWKRKLDGSFFDPTLDSRPILHIGCDKPEVIADGIDSATITATLKNDAGEIVSFSGIDYANIKGFGAKKIKFVNGSASVSLKCPASKSGKLTFEQADTTKYRLAAPITIWAVLED